MNVRDVKIARGVAALVNLAECGFAAALPAERVEAVLIATGEIEPVADTASYVLAAAEDAQEDHPYG